MSNLIEQLKRVGKILEIKKQNPEKSISEIVQEIKESESNK